jgi:PIN domain nuclease of toxin-antitoxin system
MIVLDTHIWVWWVNGSSELSTRKAQLLSSHQGDGFGVSIMSCWEVAKLVEKGRLILTMSVGQWIDQALSHPAVTPLPLTPKIAVASTQLPQPFHNDPADQIIVATARELDCSIATDDRNILSYAHVKRAWLR